MLYIKHFKNLLQNKNKSGHILMVRRYILRNTLRIKEKKESKENRRKNQHTQEIKMNKTIFLSFR